jgi:hypothetical protein
VSDPNRVLISPNGRFRSAGASGTGIDIDVRCTSNSTLSQDRNSTSLWEFYHVRRFYGGPQRLDRCATTTTTFRRVFDIDRLVFDRRPIMQLRCGFSKNCPDPLSKFDVCSCDGPISDVTFSRLDRHLVEHFLCQSDNRIVNFPGVCVRQSLD